MTKAVFRSNLHFFYSLWKLQLYVFLISLPSISTSLVLEMQGSPEIALVSYSAFKSNPPNEFRQNETGTDNLRLPDSTQVTIISDKQELSNTPKINIVKTVSELDALRNQIFNRPLLLFVTCGRHVPHGQR